MDGEQVPERQRCAVKEQILLKVAKHCIFWRAIIVHILKRHGIKKIISILYFYKGVGVKQVLLSAA